MPVDFATTQLFSHAWTNPGPITSLFAQDHNKMEAAGRKMHISVFDTLVALRAVQSWARGGTLKYAAAMLQLSFKPSPRQHLKLNKTTFKCNKMWQQSIFQSPKYNAPCNAPGLCTFDWRIFSTVNNCSSPPPPPPQSAPCALHSLSVLSWEGMIKADEDW